ncbi:MAG: HDIG domain-containing metalloprotein [Thermincolia bacterium]
MEILHKLLDLTENRGWQLYLVGGAVRDILAGDSLKDLDLVVVDSHGNHSQPAMELARAAADQLKGSFVPLDEGRGVARVVLPQGEPDTIDFARMQGSNLEEDLARRDFTVNAMALPIDREIVTALQKGNPDLKYWGPLFQEKVIDPVGGMADIRLGVLRATGEGSLVTDPLRMLRAVRIAAMKGWRVEEETVALICHHVSLLPQVARERLGEEFFKLLRQSDAARWIAYLVNEVKLLQPLWPEIIRLQETKQNYHHTVDAWSHCLAVLEEMEKMLAVPEFFPPDLRGAIANHGSGVLVKGKSIRGTLWKFIALFHDVGKTVTARLREDGRISFSGHDQKGSEMIREIGWRIGLSNKELALAQQVVKGHMRPLQLFGCRSSQRAIHRFFRDFGEGAVDILVLSLADYGAKARFKGESGKEFKEFVLGLLRRYYFDREKVLPIPVLSGREIMEAFPGIKRREIGCWLERLVEAQVEGLLRDKEGAMEYIRRHLIF